MRTGKGIRKRIEGKEIFDHHPRPVLPDPTLPGGLNIWSPIVVRVVTDPTLIHIHARGKIKIVSDISSIQRQWWPPVRSKAIFFHLSTSNSSFWISAAILSMFSIFLARDFRAAAVFRARLTATVSFGSSTLISGSGLSLFLGLTPATEECRPVIEPRDDDCPGDDWLRDMSGAPIVSILFTTCGSVMDWSLGSSSRGAINTCVASSKPDPMKSKSPVLLSCENKGEVSLL